MLVVEPVDANVEEVHPCALCAEHGVEGFLNIEHGVFSLHNPVSLTRISA